MFMYYLKMTIFLVGAIKRLIFHLIDSRVEIFIPTEL